MKKAECCNLKPEIKLGAKEAEARGRRSEIRGPWTVAQYAEANELTQAKARRIKIEAAR